MKITVYVNIETCKVYNEKDFNELLKEKTEMLTKDKDEFSEYLSDTYYPLELFQLTEEERKDVRSDFEENWCPYRAKKLLLKNGKYFEGEVEI